jgi:hypothetical protein
MGKTVRISIPLNMVETKLVMMLNDPNGALIARTILANLETTETGIHQLLMALMGVEEKLPWLIGDECLVETANINSWNCEKAAMMAAGMSMHLGHFRVKIIDINIRKEDAVRISFDGLYKSGSTVENKKIEQWIHVDKIKSLSVLGEIRPDLVDKH